MPSFHYPWSPSAMKRLTMCPGSLELSKGVPNETSIFAEEGTRAHDVCEEALVTGKDPGELTDNDEMADAARTYVDAITEWKNRYVEYDEFVEVTLVSTEFADLGGTSDDMLFAKDADGNTVLHICDFKYGMGVAVDVVDNAQLLTYCILGKQFLELLGYEEEIDIYRLMIVQPRASGNDTVQVWDTTPERVQEWYETIQAAMGQSKLKSGSWCRWCPVLRSKAGCPELKRQTTELFEHVEDEYTDAMIEDWLRFHEMGPAVKKFLDRIPDHLLAAAKEGREVPGYKVVASYGHRKYNESGNDLIGELKSAGVPEQAMYSKKVKTPPQLERAGYGKEIEHLVYKPQAGHKLVPVSAPGVPVCFDDLFDSPEE